MSLNIYSTFAINHNEAATLIRTNGAKISYVIESEPGVGKSSILKTIEKQMGDKYEYIYVDVPLLDIPNIALSMPDHDTQTTKEFVNELWLGKDPKKPKVIMLDEIWKGQIFVQLMMNRLLLEKVVGGRKLPEGSIVFGTSNFSTDGVGDKTNGHTNSRVARIQMRKPTQPEWTNWAINNNINEVVLAWIGQNPAIFSSYKDTEFDSKLHKDGQGIFHYIYHPQHNNMAYVCPRTLELASHQLHNIELTGESLLTKALIGTLGSKAALDLTALMALGADLPHPDDIVKNPAKAKVPKSAAAQMMLIYKSLQYINKDNIAAWTCYFERFSIECYSTWVKTAASAESSKPFILRHQPIIDFALANSWIL